MIHNISTRTLCLFLLLFSFMINNTLSNIANSNASNSIVTPSTSILIEISMINAIIPSIIVNTGVHRCRTDLTNVSIPVVVTISTTTIIAINTIMIIISSTRLLLLLLLTSFINLSMSTNPITTTIIVSRIANVRVNSSDRSSTTTIIVVVAMVSINIKFKANYCGTRTNAANNIITTFILFTSIRFSTIAFTNTISTTIMIIVLITTISISVAGTITLPSIICS